MLSLSTSLSSHCCGAQAIPNKQLKPSHYLCGACLKICQPSTIPIHAHNLFLTIEETRQALKKSYESIQQYIRKGYIKPIKHGKHILIPQSQVQTLLMRPDGRIKNLENITARRMARYRPPVDPLTIPSRRISDAVTRIQSLEEREEQREPIK